MAMLIFDPFTDLFITLCIVVNTLFMALDMHDMDPGLNEILTKGNYVSIRLSQVSSLSPDNSCITSVLHGDLCHRGVDEDDGHEPQVLLPGGMEHL